MHSGWGLYLSIYLFIYNSFILEVNTCMHKFVLQVVLIGQGWTKSEAKNWDFNKKISPGCRNPMNSAAIAASGDGIASNQSQESQPRVKCRQFSMGCLFHAVLFLILVTIL